MTKVIDDPNVDVHLPDTKGTDGAMQARYAKLMQGVKESPTNTKLYQTLTKNADSVWKRSGYPVSFSSGNRRVRLAQPRHPRLRRLSLSHYR